ncbi:MAG TPA: tetratricopeptide repeat protein, partial [Ardenticatenaceae bacterium]|nr:tetratricopeptide repeat protein [Ardenticatenaceae bacterium]
FEALRAALVPPGSIDTGGGAAIGGNVEQSGGNLAGRDQTINNITNNYNLDRPTAERLLAELLVPARHRPRAPRLEGEVFGQEALKAELLAALTQTGATVGLTALRGMPGVGKTTLALWVANQTEIRDAFPDGVLWASLGEMPDVMGMLGSWLGELGGGPAAVRELASVQERSRALRQLLEERRCLLVVDDVWRVEDAWPLLEARGERCAALVTSRLDPVVADLAGADNVRKVEPLEEDPALAMLRVHAGQTAFDRLRREQDRATGKDAAVALVTALGHLPLALRVAGAQVRRRARAGLNPGGLLATLRSKERELLKMGGSKVRAGRPETLSVDAVIRVSYAALPDEETRRAFRQLAVFGPKPLAFDLPATTAVWNVEPEEAEARLVALMDAGLIELFGETEAAASAPTEDIGLDGDPQYTLHQVIYAFAGEELAASGAEAEARRAHALYYLAAGSEADNLFKRGGAAVVTGLRQFDRLWPQVQRARDWMAGREDEVALFWRSKFPIWMPYVLDLRLVPRQRIPILADAVEAAQQLGDKHGEGAALGNLGLAYAALGEVRRAIEFYKQVLEIMREIGDRRGEGAALGNLGAAYADLGEVQRAIEFYEQYLAVAREIGDRRGEGAALGNLGLAYADLGEVQRAIDFYEQHLAVARQIGDRRGEALTAWNLGIAYETLEEFSRACALMGILVAYEREIGHPDAEADAARMEEVCRKAEESSVVSSQ